MPELPEVETIKKQLQNKIIGKKIKLVEIKLPRFINLSVNDFKKTVEKTTIIGISRRAKILIISLSNNWSLIIHLKLTGQLIYKKNQSKIDKYTHLIFHFTDKSQLFYNDLRQFGYIKLIESKKVSEFLIKENFGPEPLEKDFTLEKFKKLLVKKSRQKIKPLLMDQTFLAGIGNVYAQEICFYAKILPYRKVSTLSDREIKKIYDGIKRILTSAIAHRGSSVDTYLDIYGLKGEYIPFLKVYNRENQPCLNCKTKIKTISLAGRGTCFCPGCQK